MLKAKYSDKILLHFHAYGESPFHYDGKASVRSFQERRTKEFISLSWLVFALLLQHWKINILFSAIFSYINTVKNETEVKACWGLPGRYSYARGWWKIIIIKQVNCPSLHHLHIFMPLSSVSVSQCQLLWKSNDTDTSKRVNDSKGKTLCNAGEEAEDWLLVRKPWKKLTLK